MDDESAERGPPLGTFEPFVSSVEPGLRRALVAAYGSEVGRDAALDALAWAWRNWHRVERLHNPGGYLYRVGQNSARRHLRREQRWRSLDLAPVSPVVWVGYEFEPKLDRALVALSPRQRVAVFLVHGHGYSLSEAAAVMGCSISSARTHVDRALARLREVLGAPDGA